VRKVNWKGCGNAATARGGHDTVRKHSSVSFHREGGSMGSGEQLRVSKRTSGRPTADLHLANPSSYFLDPAWLFSSFSCRSVQIPLNFNQN